MPRKINPGIIKNGSGLANVDSVDASSFTDSLVLGQQSVTKAIAEGDQKLGNAYQITTTGTFGQYFTQTVQGNLDEIAALIPQKPPALGEYSNSLTFSGIPDWGYLKLNDAGLIARGLVTPPDTTNPNSDRDVYPYYWVPPEVADDDNGTNPLPFVPQGNDPATDPVFNVADVFYSGGGPGIAHAGGFTRFGAVVETARVIPPTSFPNVVISGALFPADRGVLALIHWPPGADRAGFLLQAINQRCPAAILLGQGINGATPDSCDGDAGGIFSEGDIYDFPGRATGQLDLVEIHAGINSQTGLPLPAGPLPAAGKVRLGTDPNAGPVVPGGIPILGGTSIADGGGDDNNFFRYRLPYLEDYSTTTGIKYTPTVEKPRYFTKPAISLDPLVDLTQAGNYDNFGTDYWTYQVARYRHRFEFITACGCPPGVLVDDGTYILLHFKSERNFEAFVRDGIFPDDPTDGYELWGAGLVDYANPESPDNLTQGGLPADLDIPASTAYHTIRSAVAQDLDIVDLSAVNATYDFTNTVDSVMSVSGVQYFVSNNTAPGDGFQINDVNLLVDRIYRNSYLLGQSSVASDITPGLRHRQPLFMYVGGFTSTNLINLPGIPTFAGVPLPQRIEFNYVEIGNPSGPYSLVAGPAVGDQASLVLTPVDPPLFFFGDDITCHFWKDARVRAFGRRPKDHETVAGSAIEMLFDRPGGDRLLFHTTSQGPNYVSLGEYGNFTVAPNNFPRAGLETARKDTEELFLDEVYRWFIEGIPLVEGPFDGIRGNITGPGLPFVTGKIEVPVRVGSSNPLTFGQASFLQQNKHLVDLATDVTVNRELQVGGFPDKNPPLSEGVTGPVPQTGLLQYPKLDFTTGYRPSFVAGDITNPQFDYTTATGDRSYIRVFDVGFKNAAPEDQIPEAEGQPFTKLFIRGLTLGDITYFPGLGPGNAAISIEVKVPGLTSWMDIGRRDGDGPSKQDPWMDGAGCQVVGAETFDAVNPTTGELGCQVKINVGPVATFFKNLDPSIEQDIIPLMVKVTIKDTPEGRALDWTQGTVNTQTSGCRGLVAIGIVPKNGSVLNPIPIA